MPTIRLAAEADAEQIAAIYAPFCEDGSAVSFEVEPPSLGEVARRIVSTLERYPWLVCSEGDEVLGYVYASGHNERAAYRWSVNVTVYLAPGSRGKGIGRALYTSLFALLKIQGYVGAFAGITLPNPSSIGLHESMGFEPVGVYRSVGFKGGSWHDTAWMQRPLVEKPGRPSPPLTLAEARALPGWAPAMEAGLSLIRPT